MMGDKAKLSLFLENNKTRKNNEAAYIYDNPVDVIVANHPTEIESAFKQIKQSLKQNFHVAGWISYEAGLYFEKKLRAKLPENFKIPLLYMGVYENRKILDDRDADYYWQSFRDRSRFEISNLHLSRSRESYQKSFDQIQNYLNAGDIYQVNFTQKAEFDFRGEARALYATLRDAQSVEYAAFIESDNLNVLSLSPELFIRKKGNNLTTKPMKGTHRRGRTSEEDIDFSEALKNSEKERAENLMIVDLLRNDLSKFADKGSVEVTKLFEVEKYRTLFTMTSTVEATVGPEVSALDVLTSIFPCGSVTGAPKIRAQEIICELEGGERGIYTGAIGYFTPDNDMCFSVPIRTITLDHHGKGELGIGGAIVADSVAQSEYEECLLKAQFLTHDYPAFALIESLAWSAKDGFVFLKDHLQRLHTSADYFSFSFDQDEVEAALKDHCEYISGDQDQIYKVRLLLAKSGTISITSEKIRMMKNTELATAKMSEFVIDSQDPIRFHKTTLRGLYASEYNKHHKETGCFDVIFTNERGEVTEGSFTNIFIEKDGIFYTPPVKCGLLGGILRQSLLMSDPQKYQEKIISLKELKSAGQVFLCNSVRGMIAVQMI
ncbi:MAG: aminodeoxychorismate synthase component I [Alphaproteobacteria bacterium]|nr:aminodeoxychorismate synthase component I [Alphaproteobacteria bacterium]HPF47347.1 aminodeoxychorismate synthase component I [Emcibacteraceae bacterium]HRW29798.1 aminodeoxychorismate synthase component I [Emcibacteraceae bacterium]